MENKTRRDSSIISVRDFHNWIKNKQIVEAVDYIRTNYGSVDIKLLDLAVGRGGDMKKWRNAGVTTVLGVDIDKESINEAERRYTKIANTNTKYQFVTYDLSDPKNTPHLDDLVGETRYDIVSCQFALHYFFRTKQDLQQLIRTVKRYISDTGLFIGTTMDGEKVRDAVDVVKEVYSIKKINFNSNSPYGNKYKVSLGSQGEDHYFSQKPSIEYTVDIEELKRVCNEYNLRFIGTVPFEDYYDVYTESRKDSMSEQEKEFSFMNFGFLFTSK